MNNQNPNFEPSFLRVTEKDTNSNNTQHMALKIIQDVNFLKDRIERVKRLHTPNSSVLRTYESMLSTRLAVLDWMRANGQLDEIDDTTHGKADRKFS